ncbi:YebG family protein [Azotobacter beijerinckii]|uniref:YebG family protein n=1 Tax=Azotobacter beijerinckii TaxID=170623 RepID=UPI002955B863|nr:YebG family protein [Azotobacter beijerinckii]MDV7210181.1 YebG family protein [Azotobacter beijerinckii]
MAVEILYRSSRDPEKLFMDRAEADAHDRMLELAESVQAVILKAVPSISEEQAEELGIYMAKNRDVFAKAFSKKPDALNALITGIDAGKEGDDNAQD